MTIRHDVVGIVLAAGESRRMGLPKPLLRVAGETYLARVATAMLGAVDRLIVVLGAHLERIEPAVPHDARIEVVVNPDFARGQLSSLKAGLARITPQWQAVMVHLIDHPMVTATTFQTVVQHYRQNRDPITIVRYRGRRGHPVVFDHGVFAELAAAPEEQGARVVVNADAARVAYLEVPDPGVVLDLDTPEDVTGAGLKWEVEG